MPPMVHFVAGLPRSGSTLLQNILGQNPRHHVTPTSGLLWMMGQLRDNWTTCDAFRAQGLEQVELRIPKALRGMTYGFYEQELAAGKIVFDKNRGWPQLIELLERTFNRPVPILCPIRDVKAILASFERLHRANPVARRPYLGATYFQATTVDGRARVLTGPSGIVGLAVNHLRDALARGMADRLIFVPYVGLTTYPVEVLARVHELLHLPPFDYDPDNVQQITVEDDTVHGWGDLHTIRPVVAPPIGKPWEGVLPEHTCRWVDEEFGDMNEHARGLVGSG